MVKTKFSREKHIETGATLARLNRDPTVIEAETRRVYGSQSKTAKTANKALNDVERLRSFLDDKLASECPDEEWTEGLCRVYYPPGADDA